MDNLYLLSQSPLISNGTFPGSFRNGWHGRRCLLASPNIRWCRNFSRHAESWVMTLIGTSGGRFGN